MFAQYRIAIYAAVLALAFLAGWTVQGWRAEAAQKRAAAQAQAEYIKLRDQKDAEIARRDEASRQSAQGYQDEIDKLRANRTPAPRLRCTVQAAVPGTSGLPASGNSPDGSAPGAGALPDGPGFDPAGPVLNVGSQCDEIAARLRALQDFVRRQHEIQN